MFLLGLDHLLAKSKQHITFYFSRFVWFEHHISLVHGF
jgi:hypothetical protein